MSIVMMTPEFVVSFPTLFTPKPDSYGNDKYSVQMAFKKSQGENKLESMKWFKEGVRKAIVDKWGEPDANGEYEYEIAMPKIKDSDSAAFRKYGIKDSWLVSASSTTKPAVVNQKVEPIINKDELYAGCIAIAQVSFYGYEARNAQGQVVKRGVSVSFDAVQKIADGEHIGRAPVDPKQVFAPIASAESGAVDNSDAFFND